jgi:hypothetical protein
MIDSHVVDVLLEDEVFRNNLRDLAALGVLHVLITHVQADELRMSAAEESWTKRQSSSSGWRLSLGWDPDSRRKSLRTASHDPHGVADPLITASHIPGGTSGLTRGGGR